MTFHTARYYFKLFIWIPLWILFSGLAAGQCPDGPDGIVGYWSLDGGSPPYEDNIVASGEQSGYCDGGSSGCPSRTSGGVIGAGQIYDGSNDGIYVQASSSLDWSAGESFAVEVWGKRSLSGVAAEEALVARRDSASGMAWRLSLVNSGSGVQAHFSLTDDAGTSQQITGSKEIANDTWHHIAVVHDASSGTLTLFVDGLMDASATAIFSGGFASSSASLTMGYVDDDSAPLRFGGTLDEVALYDEALTDREVAGHYYLARNYCEMYDEDIKVMPIGDSITKGSYTPTGSQPSPDYDSYRKDVWEDLFTDMIWVDFIGRLYSGDGFEGASAYWLNGELYDPDSGYPSTPPSYPSNPSYDIDHEGHPGIQTYQLATTMQYIMPASPNLDVALLHIGTNVPDGATASTDDLEEVLDNLLGNYPNVTIIVAKIISTRDSGFPRSILEDYNVALENVVRSRIESGEKLILADMTSTGANLLYADYINNLHPNSAGYAKMATEWLTQLDKFMPRFEAPVITTTALPPATRGVPYSFTVSATGRPGPDYVLGTSPSDMTIDADGKLAWTPPGSAPAQETVEITAVLPGGNSDWSGRSDTATFTLALNSQPTAGDDTYGPIAGLLPYTVSAGDGLLANDDDPDSGDKASLTAVLVEGPSHGTLTLEEDGGFTYTYTNGSSNITDSFTYSASDGKAASAPATVTFNVQPALSTDEETPITIGLEDFAYLPSGSTSIAIDPGANYTVSGSTVTPADDFDDVLTVGVRFLAGASQVGSFDLSINVVGVNDAPEILGQGDIRTPVDTAVTISVSNLNIDDPDNSSQDFVLSLLPGDNYTFTDTTITPAAGFNGNLTVPVKVSDGDLDSAPFNLTVTVGSGDSSSSGGGGGGCFIGAASQKGRYGLGILSLVGSLLLLGWSSEIGGDRKNY
jgi:VCBS repeat-containing protein